MAKNTKRRKGERLVGLIILAGLCLIGIMVFLEQFQFNPGVTALNQLEAIDKQTSSTEPPTLVPFPDTLSVTLYIFSLSKTFS